MTADEVRGSTWIVVNDDQKNSMISEPDPLFINDNPKEEYSKEQLIKLIEKYEAET